MRFIIFDSHGREICRDVIPFRCRGRMLKILMLFDQDEILFDVQNLAAAQGDAARLDDATGEKIEQFKNICEENNIERPIKTISLALSKCEKKLHKWCGWKANEFLSIDNYVHDKKEFVMEMKVEEHFTTELAFALMRHVQEFIEMFVLYDWAGATYPEGKEHWAEMLASAEEEIKDLVTYIDDDCEAYIPPSW